MYAARQNKEKVSRRIDSASGGARQRVKLENTHGMKQSNANGICQLIKSEYDNSVQIYDNDDGKKQYALIIGTQTGKNVNFMGHSGLMFEGYYGPNQEHW